MEGQTDGRKEGRKNLKTDEREKEISHKHATSVAPIRKAKALPASVSVALAEHCGQQSECRLGSPPPPPPSTLQTFCRQTSHVRYVMCKIATITCSRK